MASLLCQLERIVLGPLKLYLTIALQSRSFTLVPQLRIIFIRRLSDVFLNDGVVFIVRERYLIIVRVIVKFLWKLLRWTLFDDQTAIDHRRVIVDLLLHLEDIVSFGPCNRSRRAELLDALTRLDCLVGVRYGLLTAFHGIE